MENLVIDTTPKGSAILAYGTSRGPRRPGRLLALLAGSLLVFPFLLLWIFALVTSIPAPEHPLVLASMKPKTIQSKLHAPLLQDLPAPWRSALQSGGSFPALLGVSIDETGGPVYFAVTLDLLPRSAEAGLSTKTVFPFLLRTSANEYKAEPFPVRAFLRLALRAMKHDASWQIENEALISSVDVNAAANGVITGTWDGLRGVIDLPPDNVSAIQKDGSDLVVTLSNPTDDAASVLDALLEQGVDIRGVGTPPSHISIHPTSGPLLAWDAPLTPDDLSRVSGAFGETTSTEIVLPDGTLAYALKPRSSTTGSGDLSFGNPEGDAGAGQEQGCPGLLRLRIAGNALKNLLSSIHVAESWQNFLSNFEISQTDRGVFACVRTGDLQKR